MMSKYKTPIRIQLDITRKINQSTNKYKLPFRKDDPVIQKSFSTKERQQSSIVQSQVKEGHKNLSQINESCEPQSNKQQQQEKRVQAQNIQKEQQKDEQKKVDLKIEKGTDNSMPAQLIGQSNKILKHKSRRLKLSTQLVAINIQSNNKTPKRLLTESKKQKHRFSDADQKSMQECNQTDLDRSCFLTTNKLPSILHNRQLKPRVVHSSLKKNQKSTWQMQSNEKQEVQSDASKYQMMQSMKKKGRERLNVSSSNQSQLIIENDVKFDKNEHLYDQLQQINEDSQVTEISKQIQLSFASKLDQFMCAQDYSKKSKKKVVLEQYKQQYELTKMYNPFFRKLNELAGCIMFSVGKIRCLSSGDLLYTQGEPISHLSIIFLGKISLSKAYNKSKTFAFAGQTLGEEALFEESRPYHLRPSSDFRPIFYKMTARACNKVYILRINLRKFYKACIQLHINGYKRLFNLVDNLFKINYLKKSAFLRQQAKERMQTQILGSLKKKNSSFFFK